MHVPVWFHDYIHVYASAVLGRLCLPEQPDLLLCSNTSP